jgi:hypothetical protein
VFWVISVYFNIRNILPKFFYIPPGTFCIRMYCVCAPCWANSNIHEVQLLQSHRRGSRHVSECATFPDTTLKLTQTNCAQCTVAAPVTSFPGTPSSASYLDGCQHSCRFRRVAFVMLLRTAMPVHISTRSALM